MYIFYEKIWAHKNANQTKTNQQNKTKWEKNNKGKNFSCIKTPKREEIGYFAFLKKNWNCPDNLIYYTTYIFLTKGSDIVWLTASIKLRHQNLQSGNSTFKVTWPFDYVVTWQMKKIYICTFAIPMAIKLGRVVVYSWKTPHT